MLNISKDTSTLIKGVVIMMMLVVHLFNGSHIDLCTHWFHIGDAPLISWLSRACGPVPFFMLLSGYGLAYKYEGKGIRLIDQLRRILRLYLHYWVILAVCLIVGYLLFPAKYPGSLRKVIVNMLGWDVTYNAEMWFLFPYCIISLFSMYIIRAVEKVGNVWALVISIGIMGCTSFLISRYGDFLFHNMTYYQPLLCFHLLQPFVMGVVLRRTSLPLNRPMPQWLVLVLIAALVLLTCVTHSSFRYILYVPLLVFLLCHIHWPQWLKAVLMELGRKSMTIWMIHTWLAFYLFTDQVYALRYPLVIFLGVLVASYLLSIPVMWVAGKINGLIPDGKK